MNRVAFDEGPQLGSQGFVGHQVDRAAEQVLEIELDPEISRGTSRAVEADQDVRIAVVARMVASAGAEQRQTQDTESALQSRLVLPQGVYCLGPIHGLDDAALQPGL